MRRVSALLVLTVLLLAACGGAASGARPSPSASPHPTPAPTPTPIPQLTLSGLFHPTKPMPTGPGVRTLNATGDVIPARLLNQAAVQRNDFDYAFEPVQSYVADADVTYIDLESPLLAGCQVDTSGLTFCGDQRWITGVEGLGTDVANLANNHVDPGAPATQTAQFLNQNGIRATTQLGPPVVLQVKGMPFAFVGCNAVDGVPVDRAALAADIQTARSMVGAGGVVVVQFHWGKEYQRLPQPAPGLAPDNPVDLGHLAIDSGADLVIGNHPHWVQPVEIYKNHIITYAEGNFAFDQVNCYPSVGSDYQTYCSNDTRTSVVATFTFQGTHVVGMHWKPTFESTDLQTQWADPAYAAQVMQTMEQASDQLATQLGEPVN